MSEPSESADGVSGDLDSFFESFEAGLESREWEARAYRRARDIAEYGSHTPCIEPRPAPVHPLEVTGPEDPPDTWKASLRRTLLRYGLIQETEGHQPC